MEAKELGDGSKVADQYLLPYRSFKNYFENNISENVFRLPTTNPLYIGYT